MARAPRPLPETEEGHLERLRRAQERTVRVLSHSLAQSPDAPTLGMSMTLSIDATTGTVLGRPNFAAPDGDQLAVVATLARPFSLSREAIYGPGVAKSLSHFAVDGEQRKMCEQLETRLWPEVPLRRMKTLIGRADGTPILPEGGEWNGEVADRVLYSELVHADDASDLLDHIDSPEKQWSLAGLVGDWLAVIAHQQALIRWIRPTVCDALTPWAGDPQTIFRRLGVLR